MGRSKGAKTVTPDEIRRIRELHRQGVRWEDIQRIVGRVESTVQLAVRGAKKRTRPFPKRRNEKRDARIVHLILAKGWTGARVAKLYGITPTYAYELARTAALGYSQRQRRVDRKRRAKLLAAKRRAPDE